MIVGKKTIGARQRYFGIANGLTRDELRYILDPKDVYGTDFPGETFRVLKEKEEKQYGEYRTGRLVFEACDKLEAKWPFAIRILLKVKWFYAADL